MKETSYDARLEADGLAALAAAGAPVPAVHAADRRRLTMDHVHGNGDWGALAEALAKVHETTNDRFGWHGDNVIGPLPQANPWESDWPTFYVEHRVRPWIGELPGDVAARLHAACDGPLPDLLDHDVAPSLVHGDLWAGNVVGGEWLIDPAVHFADRELDLAFSTVFGGIPEEFYRAYESVWPLDPGWQERRPALQLYHLLVHVAIEGPSYVGSVTSRLDALGW